LKKQTLLQLVGKLEKDIVKLKNHLEELNDCGLLESDKKKSITNRIKFYESILSEFNKQLINSSFIINPTLLERYYELLEMQKSCNDKGFYGL
jgi:hypothetical protein